MVTDTALAGPFDGNWIGQIPPSGGCHAVATMTITVSGDTLSGVVHNLANVRPFTGTVDADGNATFTVPEFHYSGTIKFTADHFDANWNSGNCQRHSLGDRAPDATQTAALIAQRKQAQDTYDDLTAKAAAGDRAVDFTALRASYPFTKQWDVYGKTSAPLMEQANAAAKGKDCVTALEKIDEVLKIDYTIIAAHRVRSDCLKGDAARIESRIADGLMDSLTRGGNGKSETTAYPVMTVHEETDILKDKRIVIKTRDVAVRGSNGRFYDVVHGVSIWNNEIHFQDVYFDVSTEVTGRSSAMALADAMTSAPP
ncbi:MAG: hypothetical protein ABSF96_05955 [Steroidobacteraceae bacterium]